MPNRRMQDRKSLCPPKLRLKVSSLSAYVASLPVALVCLLVGDRTPKVQRCCWLRTARRYLTWQLVLLRRQISRRSQWRSPKLPLNLTGRSKTSALGLDVPCCWNCLSRGDGGSSIVPAKLRVGPKGLITLFLLGDNPMGPP